MLSVSRISKLNNYISKKSLLSTVIYVQVPGKCG